MDLLHRVPSEAEYVCFVDQDDVWHPSKLWAAVDALSRRGNTPTLWVCNLAPISSRGDIRRDVRIRSLERCRPSWRNALVENIAPGCTMVWNAALQQILVRAKVHTGVVMHDWWAYAVASMFGRVIIDPAPRVRYRLHDANSVGLDRRLQTRLRRFALRGRSTTSIESQARALLREYGSEMSVDQVELTDALACHRRGRLTQAVGRRELYRQAAHEQILLLARLGLS